MKLRGAKRRIDELDEKIENVSKMIKSFSGHNKIHLENKLLNAKLKKQRLEALSVVARGQKLLSELNEIIAENDLIAEIESLTEMNEYSLEKKAKRVVIYDDYTSERMFRHSTPIRTNSERAVFTSSSNHYNDTNELIQDLLDTTPSIAKNCATLYVDETNELAIDLSKPAPSLNMNCASLNPNLNKIGYINKDLSTPSAGKNYATLDADDTNDKAIDHSKTAQNLEINNRVHMNPCLNKPTVDLSETTPSIIRKRLKLPPLSENNISSTSKLAVSRLAAVKSVSKIKSSKTVIIPTNPITDSNTNKERNEIPKTHRNVLSLYQAYEQIYSSKKSQTQNFQKPEINIASKPLTKPNKNLSQFFTTAQDSNLLKTERYDWKNPININKEHKPDSEKARNCNNISKLHSNISQEKEIIKNNFGSETHRSYFIKTSEKTIANKNTNNKASNNIKDKHKLSRRFL